MISNGQLPAFWRSTGTLSRFDIGPESVLTVYPEGTISRFGAVRVSRRRAVSSHGSLTWPAIINVFANYRFVGQLAMTRTIKISYSCGVTSNKFGYLWQVLIRAHSMSTTLSQIFNAYNKLSDIIGIPMSDYLSGVIKSDRSGLLRTDLSLYSKVCLMTSWWRHL